MFGRNVPCVSDCSDAAIDRALGLKANSNVPICDEMKAAHDKLGGLGVDRTGFVIPRTDSCVLHSPTFALHSARIGTQTRRRVNQRRTHMKQHIVVATCGAVALILGTAQFALAAMDSVRPVPPKRVETVLCPEHVSVVLQPTSPAPGWKTNKSPVTLSPDTKNLPRVESKTLICYYAMPDGYNAFTYFQAQGARTCTVRPDHKGFECH